MFKLAVLIASLAYASAGYAGTEHSYAAPVAARYSSAPAVSYSSFNRHQNVAPEHHGYAHAAPVLTAPSHAYATAPLAYTYAAAPTLSHGYGYAPSQSYDNYGYSGYAASLAAKTFAVAQPQLYHHNSYATQAVVAPVLATRGYNYAPGATGAHLLGYNNHHSHYDY